MTDSSIPHKQCFRKEHCVNPLGSILPATKEYFYPDKSKPYGVRNTCKACELKGLEERRREAGVNPKSRPAMDGYKVCGKCLQEKPATLEYFRRKSDGGYGVHSVCWDCERAKQGTLEHKAAQRAYFQSPAGKTAIRKHYYSNTHKISRAKYEASGAGKRSRQKYQNSTSGKVNRHRNVLKYRARRRGLPDNFEHSDWHFALDWWGNCCAYCGSQQGLWNPITADHFIPLNSPDCLGTVPLNMLPACRECNSSKQARNPVDWLTWKFGKRKVKATLKRIGEYFHAIQQKADRQDFSARSDTTDQSTA